MFVIAVVANAAFPVTPTPRTKADPLTIPSVNTPVGDSSRKCFATSLPEFQYFPHETPAGLKKDVHLLFQMAMKIFFKKNEKHLLLFSLLWCIINTVSNINTED